MRAILVKTGKYQIQDENKYCSVSPELLLDNFYKAVMYILAATDMDPDKDLDAEEEARKKAKLKTDDFFKRLNAYASDDCGSKRIVCPETVGEFVW